MEFVPLESATGIVYWDIRQEAVLFPNPTNPAWITFSIACWEENLVTFVMFLCSLQDFMQTIVQYCI